jgi:hypothetical protein
MLTSDCVQLSISGKVYRLLPDEIRRSLVVSLVTFDPRLTYLNLLAPYRITSLSTNSLV